MLKVNSVSPAFKGAWGDIQFVNGKPEIKYYPLKDETEVETKLAVEKRLKQETLGHTQGPLAKWYEKGQEVNIIISKPLKFTKEALEKFNRGYISDALAKFLK